MAKFTSQLVARIKQYISLKLYNKAVALRYMENGEPDYLYTGLIPSNDVLKKAFKLFLTAAKLGNDDAQYEVATMYYHGYGVVSDKLNFEYWSISAYMQGHAMALLKLANYHRASKKRVECGDGYIDLIDLAYEEYEVLAKADIGDAQEILGDMYRIGEGNRTPDREKAIYWYDLAAENGMGEAMDMLKHLKSQS